MWGHSCNICYFSLLDNIIWVLKVKAKSFKVVLILLFWVYFSVDIEFFNLIAFPNSRQSDSFHLLILIFFILGGHIEYRTYSYAVIVGSINSSLHKNEKLRIGSYSTSLRWGGSYLKIEMKVLNYYQKLHEKKFDLPLPLLPRMILIRGLNLAITVSS